MTTFKIAIVGAGVVGLSTAVALRKYVGPDIDLDIQIYERLDIGDMNYPIGREEDQITAEPTLGSAIALQDNGMRTLGQLDARIEASVLEGGLKCQGFRIMTEADYSLGVLAKSCVAAARGKLLGAIREVVPKDIIHQKAVREVITNPGQLPQLLLEGDDSPITVDLIIGADGIRSPTRAALLGESEKYRPQYSGSCAVGGFHNMPVPDHLVDDPAMVFTWGSTGFFGYSALSKSDRTKMMYWSVYDHPLPPKSEKVDLNSIDQMLRARHGHWESPIIKTILSSAKVDSLWPIFYIPKLPYWGRDGVVIIGDAAHAMTPQSGQGSSQGIEDAQTIGLLLKEELRRASSREEAVGNTIDALYRVRKDRVWGIHEKAMSIAQPKFPMSPWQKYVMYAFFFVFARLAPWLDNQNEWDAKTAVKEYYQSQG